MKRDELGRLVRRANGLLARVEAELLSKKKAAKKAAGKAKKRGG